MQPNPVSDVLVAHFSLRENSDLQLQITDVAGKIIENQRFEGLPAGEQQLQLESAHWKPGIYFATLRDANGGVSVKKVVKM